MQSFVSNFEHNRRIIYGTDVPGDQLISIKIVNKLFWLYLIAVKKDMYIKFYVLYLNARI